MKIGKWFKKEKKPRKPRARKEKPISKRWQVKLAKIVNEWPQARVSVRRLKKHLKESGCRVDSIRIGLLMGDWGHKSVRFKEGGKKVRGYELNKWEKKEVWEKAKKAELPANMIAFKCYFGEDHYNGYYILKPGERVNDEANRIISKEFPEGRLCLCPVHHKKDRAIGEREGVFVAYAVKKYPKRFKVEDGPIIFYDEIKRYQMSKGLSPDYSRGIVSGGPLNPKGIVRTPFSIGDSSDKELFEDDFSSPY